MPLPSKALIPIWPNVFVVIESASVPATIAVVASPSHSAICDLHRKAGLTFFLPPMRAPWTQRLAVANFNAPKIDAGAPKDFGGRSHSALSQRGGGVRFWIIAAIYSRGFCLVAATSIAARYGLRARCQISVGSNRNYKAEAFCRRRGADRLARGNLLASRSWCPGIRDNPGVDL